MAEAGFTTQAAHLAAELIEAAGWFDGDRLPELFCGFSRDDIAGPVPYPVACSPQAWAAAAPLAMLRALLGIQPHLAERRLDLQRPVLPERLTRLAISGLRVGGARVDLRFARRGDSTAVEVGKVTGGLSVVVSA
jgi:glycogen debranching enzyme